MRAHEVLGVPAIGAPRGDWRWAPYVAAAAVACLTVLALAPAPREATAAVQRQETRPRSGTLRVIEHGGGVRQPAPAPVPGVSPPLRLPEVRRRARATSAPEVVENEPFTGERDLAAGLAAVSDDAGEGGGAGGGTGDTAPPPPSLDDCYGRPIRHRTTLRVVVRVFASGSPQKVTVRGGDAALRECVSRVMRASDFPPGEGFHLVTLLIRLDSDPPME